MEAAASAAKEQPAPTSAPGVKEASGPASAPVIRKESVPVAAAAAFAEKEEPAPASEGKEKPPSAPAAEKSAEKHPGGFDHSEEIIDCWYMDQEARFEVKDMYIKKSSIFLADADTLTSRRQLKVLHCSTVRRGKPCNAKTVHRNK